MMTTLKSRLSRLLARSPLAYWPVTVRGGIAKGAQWTLLPHSAYWRGIGERDVEAAIKTVGNLTGATCWDLGAHFGIYTIGLARLVGPEGQIASFEPDPTSHARCARHIRMNRLTNIRLFNAAVGEKCQTEKLIISDGLGASANHLCYEGETISPTVRCIEIRILKLDELVSNGEIRPPKFAKIDVEGHGAKAIAGALQTITQHRPTLVMSFHSESELNDTQALLAPLGYRCFSPEGAPLTWREATYRSVLIRPCN